MNAAFAMDSGGVDARVHADRLDSRIRNLTEASDSLARGSSRPMSA
jgi:hypothetical protein